MTLIVKIPHANPLRFYKSDESPFGFPAHENSWMARYCQKFNQSDKLAIQVHLKEKYWRSIGLKLLDIEDNEIVIAPGTLIAAGYYSDDYRVWQLQSETILNQDPGLYRVKITVNVMVDAGPPEVTEDWIYYSEYFYIDEAHENTVLLEYGNDVNDFDLFFKTSNAAYTFQFRVEAGVMSEGLKPSSKDEVYIDQVRKVVKLDSVPYNVESWIFGPGKGIPNWMADKLNRILSCNQLTIDGQAYTKDDGAKLEPVREADYPLAGWKIDMVKDDNYYSNNYSI